MITVVYYELYSSLLEYDGLQHYSRELYQLAHRKYASPFEAAKASKRAGELLIEVKRIPEPRPGERTFQVWDVLNQDQRNRSWGYELRPANPSVVHVDMTDGRKWYAIRCGWEIRGVQRSKRTESVVIEGNSFSREVDHVETTDWQTLNRKRSSFFGDVVEPLIDEHPIHITVREVVLQGTREDVVIRDGGTEEEP